ncbi:PIN domain-containing protein [Nodosilinea sp. FACHB-131]|uniref:PIN domain-containing protein n=1 Tax=Cyanophyceae TaxID=3028117 RepID=UPI001682483E|nr:PIN domain-containing protein [Nodosilinea sp. FACHB-131]MBD1874848.1 PIN domain-containing protein [Nodosilinea sp. FACHB-131]
MSDKVFLDTNIIIYGYSQDEPDKQQRARECSQTNESWISTQVLNETVNTLKRKFSLNYRQIGAVVDELSQQSQIAIVSLNTIHKALEIAQRYQYSYFDSLIVASALEVGCDRLYSEDLQDGQEIGNVLTIINPFRDI